MMISIAIGFGFVLLGNDVFAGDVSRFSARHIFINDIYFDVMIMVHVGRFIVWLHNRTFLRVLIVFDIVIIDFSRTASNRFARHRNITAAIVDIVNRDSVKFVSSLLHCASNTATVKLTVANLDHLLWLIGLLRVHV